MQPLQGIFPIVATPFLPDGEIDWFGFENLCRVLATEGCDALTLFGIAGEYYKLSDDERWEMAKRMIAICKESGVTSIVSVTDHSTEVAVKSARRFEEMGADSLMLLPPFFLKPPADAHVRAVGRAVEIPIMLQYAPEQTGVSIPPQMLAAIANDIPTIQDFKIECKPAGQYITRLLELTDHRVRIHVGNAGYNMIETHRRGAVGAMPGCSMFDLYLRILAHLNAGETEFALVLHDALLSVLNHIRQNVEMIIRFEKHILMRRGIIAHDTCRSPSFEADANDLELFEILFERIQPHLKSLN